MLRKITSLTSFLTFVITLITSVILYIVPEGRVAYWADWHMLGLTKGQWGDVHTTVGTLFILALLFHVWLNWKPIVAYMKNQARELVIMTKPMVISLLLTVFVFAGTLAGLPPMQQLLDLSAQIKDNATETYGNPPYGHAESSPLKKFCGFLGMDVNKAIETLHDAGFDAGITADSIIKDIARSKGMSPQQVFDVIRKGQGANPFDTMPSTPPEGTGKLSVTSVSKSYGLDVADVLARLKAAGFEADETMTFKQIAAKYDVDPKDVYLAIKGE